MKKQLILGFSVVLFIGLAALSYAQNYHTPSRYTKYDSVSLFDMCPWHDTNTNRIHRHNMMTNRHMMMGCRMGNTAQRSVGMMTNNNIFCSWDAAEFNTWQRSNNISTPLSIKNARQWAEYYVNAYNNHDLVISEIVEMNHGFEIEVRSKKDDKVVKRLQVDKTSGWITQVPN